MKNRIIKNFFVVLFIIAAISFTCFAIEHKLGDSYIDPDYEVLSAYYQPSIILEMPLMR